MMFDSPSPLFSMPLGGCFPSACMCNNNMPISHLRPPFSQGTVISPSMDPSMSLQPASMMAPLTQQMSHLSLGSAGTVRELLIESERSPGSLKSVSLNPNIYIDHVHAPYMTVFVFPSMAVHAGQHTYAGSIYPTVCTRADINCSCRGRHIKLQPVQFRTHFFFICCYFKERHIWGEKMLWWQQIVLLSFPGKWCTNASGLIWQSFPIFLPTNQVVLR